MKIIAKKLIASSVLCVAAALPFTAQAGWDTDYRDIENVGAYNSGVYLTLVGANLDPECAKTVFINETDSNYKTKVAALLTAKALGSRVLINFDNPAPGDGCPLTLNRYLIE